MFERTLLTPTYSGIAENHRFDNINNDVSYFNVGAFADSLVFYDKVQICGRDQDIINFIHNIGACNVLKLMEQGRLDIIPFKPANSRFDIQGETLFAPAEELVFSADMDLNMFGEDNIFEQRIKDNLVAQNDAHKFAQYNGVLNQLSQKIISEPSLVDTLVTHLLRARGIKKDKAQGLIGVNREHGMLTMAHREGVNVHTQHFQLYYPDSFVDPSEKGMQDWQLTDSLDSTISLSRYVQRVISDIAISSANASEFTSHPIVQHAVRSIFDSTLQRVHGAEQISSFQEEVFDGPSIGQYVAQCSRLEERRERIHNLINLLEKKERFSEWLRGIEPNKTILREYIKSVGSPKRAERLPFKAVRYVMFTGMGALIDVMAVGASGGYGALMGLSLAGFDVFAVDGMANGWCPNQFVQGTVADFLLE